LDAQIQKWMDRPPYRLIHEFNSEKRLYEVYVEPVGRPTDDISVTVGDVLYNLRSTLDHLAFALAEKHSGALNAGEARQVQFPILHKEENICHEYARRIGKIAPAARAVIDGLQPYKAGNQYVSDSLYLLDELHVRDKHRSLLLILNHQLANVIPASQPVAHVEYIRFIGPAGLLEAKTKIAEYRVSIDDPKVQMKLGASFEISFADPIAKGRYVSDTLREFRDYIARTVVPALRRFLG
jgi:hypothetical protein